MIELERQLIFFDVETTGLDQEEDRIIQIAMQKFPPGLLGRVNPIDSFEQTVNPEMPVPDEVLELTGLDPEVLRDSSTFEELVEGVSHFIEGADLAGFNAEPFDWEVLQNEYDRVGAELPGPSDRLVLDVYFLEKALTSRTLEDLYKKYAGEPLEDSHRADADVHATVQVLAGQFKEHEPEAETLADLVHLSRDGYLDSKRRLKKLEDGRLLIDFGKKHSGHTVTEVLETDADWLEWAIGAIDDLSQLFRIRLAQLLEDCPTCGAETELLIYEETWRASCTGENCQRQTPHKDTAVRAVLDWNAEETMPQA